MAKSKIIITIGIIIALLPFLGFPHSWESFFQVVAGLAIVGVSVWTRIDKKITQKVKARARQARKIVSPESDETLAAPDIEQKRVTDFYPKTGQPGRRVTDIKWNEPQSPDERDESI